MRAERWGSLVSSHPWLRQAAARLGPTPSHGTWGSFLWDEGLGSLGTGTDQRPDGLRPLGLSLLPLQCVGADCSGLPSPDVLAQVSSLRAKNGFYIFKWS